jgi:hypothetical protein
MSRNPWARRTALVLATVLSALTLTTACGPDLPGNGSEHGAPGVVEPGDRVYIVEVQTTKDRKLTSREITLLTAYAVVRDPRTNAYLNDMPGNERIDHQPVPSPWRWTIALGKDWTDPVQISVTGFIRGEIGEAVQCSIRLQGHPGVIVANGARIDPGSVPKGAVGAQCITTV